MCLSLRITFYWGTNLKSKTVFNPKFKWPVYQPSFWLLNFIYFHKHEKLTKVVLELKRLSCNAHACSKHDLKPSTDCLQHNIQCNTFHTLSCIYEYVSFNAGGLVGSLEICMEGCIKSEEGYIKTWTALPYNFFLLYY